MRKALGVVAVAAAFFISGHLAGQEQQNPDTGTTGEVKVIEITAKKYGYTPGFIRVKKGTRVQLKIRATDRTHGFTISVNPEGAAAGAPPGLKFDQPQESWKLEKDHERVIEFVAERAGTYPFKCSIFCGFGHKGMKGTLVVEE